MKKEGRKKKERRKKEGKKKKERRKKEERKRKKKKEEEIRKIFSCHGQNKTYNTYQRSKIDFMEI